MAAPHLLARFTGQPLRVDLRVLSVSLLIAGAPVPGSRALPGRLPGASRLRGITRWGWIRTGRGFDGLGRIPSEQKEKETLWLT